MIKFIQLMVYGVLAGALAFAAPTFAQGDSEPLAQQVDLSGAQFIVGSKEFTEQIILGQITMQLLEAAGAEVSDQTGLAGSQTARTALESGAIDMYWEYTGTGWISYLGHTSTKVKGKLYKKVAQEDMKKNNIKWLEPAAFNDSYGIVTNQKTAKKYDISSYSDYGRLLKKHPDQGAICVGNEFAQRDDGLLGLAKAYGWQLPEDNIVIVQEALVYTQVAQGGRCNFGDVFTTDGRIAALDLVLLKDDKHFFPPYFAALTIRAETFKKYPQLAKLFGPVSKALTQDTMTSLNEAVDVKGKFPEQVAHQFLVKHNFIAE